MRKSRLFGLALALGLTAGLAVSAQPAQATNTAPAAVSVGAVDARVSAVKMSHINFGIPGSAQVAATRNIYNDSGVVLASVTFYVDQGSDVYAKLVPVPILQGTPRYMALAIGRHVANLTQIFGNCHNTVQCDKSDTYAYYAGPVKRINNSGYCIDYEGLIEYPVGGTIWVGSSDNFVCT
jgi:hypothetical protein